MGINSLRKLLNEYISTRSHKPIKSDICYIDFTYKIVLSTTNIIKKYSNTNKTTIELIDLIIDNSVTSLITQIENNRFYNEFIISMDFRNISNMNSKFKFSNTIITNYFNSSDVKSKEKIAAIPMIPKFLITDSNTTIFKVDKSVLIQNVRNLYEIRYNYWKPNKTVINYVPVKTLLEKDISIEDKEILNELMTAGYCRYILFRGAKNAIRIGRKKSNSKKNKLCSSIEEQFSGEEDFDKELRDFLLKVPYSLIISLIPNIVYRIKKALPNEKIQFIGCENESDFAIRKHILTYNVNNCPSIYTRDTDMLMLLCDVECVVKIPYGGRNIPIFPHDFWIWVFGTTKFTFNDVISICCLMGTDYTKQHNDISVEFIRKLKLNYNDLYKKIYNDILNKYLEQQSIIYLSQILTLEIYSQSDLIEYNLHFIEPEEELNYEIINLKFSNIITDNLKLE